MFATLEIFWRRLGLNIFLDFKIEIILARQIYCSGSPDSSSRRSVWRFFRCPWMVPTELCHLFIYWHEVPFFSLMSGLFAGRVQQKVITGSSAPAFLRGTEWYLRSHLVVSGRSDCQEFELLLTFCSALLHPGRIDCCLTSCSSAGWQLSQNTCIFCY